MNPRVIVGIVAVVGVATCGLFGTIANIEMVKEVNSRLPKDSQFSPMGWYLSKTLRLHHEYKRLFPNGTLLVRVRVAIGIAFGWLLAWRCVGLGVLPIEPRCSHLKELDTAVVLLKCQQEVRGSWRVTADAEVTFRGWFGQRSVSWLTGTSQLAINHPDLDCQAFRNDTSSSCRPELQYAWREGNSLGSPEFVRRMHLKPQRINRCG